MNKTAEIYSDCPSLEELSLFADFNGTTKIEEHVKTCEKCQEILKFYHFVDDVIFEDMQPNAGLADRIKSTCHNLSKNEMDAFNPVYNQQPEQEQKNNRKHISYSQVFLKYAAVIAISGLLFSSVTHWYDQKHLPKTNTITTNNTTTTEAIAKNKIPTKIQIGNKSSFDSTKYYNPAFSFQPFSPYIPDTQNVSLTQNNIASTNTTATTIVHNSGMVTRIEQIWVCKDLDNAKNLLNKFLPAGGGYELNCKTKDSLSFKNVVISERELQSLVNGLHSSGLLLISPNGPEPGKVDLSKLNNHKVYYNIKFVKQ